MPQLVLDDVKIYVGAYDLSADHNEMSLNYEAEIKDKTAFGQTARRKLAGLTNTNAEMTALYEPGVGNVDAVVWDKHADADEVVSFSPDGGQDGEPMYMAEGIMATYSPQGTIGEIFVLKTGLEGSGPLVRGKILGTGSKALTANGTPRELGAVAANKKLYATLHVLGVSGSTNPTVNVSVQSASSSGFTSPSTRISFAQKAAIGAQFATPIAGAITDTWVRARWVVAGAGSPAFNLVVSAGIK